MCPGTAESLRCHDPLAYFKNMRESRDTVAPATTKNGMSILKFIPETKCMKVNTKQEWAMAAQLQHRT
jgi:hypothetical protein